MAALGQSTFSLLGFFERLVFKRNQRDNERNFFKEIVSLEVKVVAEYFRIICFSTDLIIKL